MTKSVTLLDAEEEQLHFQVHPETDIEDEEMISEEISSFLDENFSVRMDTDEDPPPFFPNPSETSQEEFYTQNTSLVEEELLTPFYFQHENKEEELHIFQGQSETDFSLTSTVEKDWQHHFRQEQAEQIRLLESRYEEALQTISQLQVINEKLEQKIKPMEMDNQNLLDANRLLEEKINELIEKIENIHQKDVTKDQDLAILKKVNRQLLEENMQLSCRKKSSILNLFRFAF